jgi:TonB family protein
MSFIARRIALVLPLPVSLGVLACASSGDPIRSPQPLRAAPTSCASATGADTTVYDIREIDEKPVFRSALKLMYPREALHDHAQGRVVVMAIVNSGGDVDQSSVKVVRHVHPQLDAEASRIIASATLWPACRNGQAVRMRITVPFDFQMRRPILGFWPTFVIGVGAGVLAAVIGSLR